MSINSTNKILLLLTNLELRSFIHASCYSVFLRYESYQACPYRPGILTFIILFIVFLSKISNQDMAILYSDLDVENSNKVIEELGTKKIPCQILAD